LQSQIQQFEQAIFIWESAFGFGQFSEQAMRRFYGICRVNSLADIGGVAEVSRQVLPFTPL